MTVITSPLVLSKTKIRKVCHSYSTTYRLSLCRYFLKVQKGCISCVYMSCFSWAVYSRDTSSIGYFRGVGNSAQGMNGQEQTNPSTPYVYKDCKWKVFLNVTTLCQTISSRHWNKTSLITVTLLFSIFWGITRLP